MIPKKKRKKKRSNAGRKCGPETVVLTFRVLKTKSNYLRGAINELISNFK